MTAPNEPLDALSTEEVIDRFADPDLVPHGFLDLSLPVYKSADQLSDLHSKSSKLLSELDHYSQDITWKLESLMGELMRSGNRLSYEVELLKSEVSGLITDVDEQAAPLVDKLSQQTSPNDPVSRLNVLDTVKTRMVEVQKVFEEASKFDENAITNEVVGALNAGQIEVAKGKIAHAENLSLLWKGTSAYDSKTKFIAGLKKRVQAIIDSETPSSSTPRYTTPTPESPRLASQSPDTNSGESYYGLINQLQKKIF